MRSSFLTGWSTACQREPTLVHAYTLPCQMGQAGDINIATEVSPDAVADLQSNPQLKVVQGVGADIFFLLMNEKPALTGGAMSNPVVQNAVRYALDYDGINALVGGPAATPPAIRMASVRHAVPDQFLAQRRELRHRCSEDPVGPWRRWHQRHAETGRDQHRAGNRNGRTSPGEELELATSLFLKSWAAAREEFVTSSFIKSWAAALSPGLLALDLASGGARNGTTLSRPRWRAQAVRLPSGHQPAGVPPEAGVSARDSPRRASGRLSKLLSRSAGARSRASSPGEGAAAHD